MSISELTNIVVRPDLHRRILGNYHGAYVLGVVPSPDNASEGAFLLRVEGSAPADIARVVEVEGQQVPIIIKENFRRPVAY